MRELTQKEIADVLGIGTRQVRNLEAEGMPHRAEGKTKFYPVPDAVTWYRRREVEREVAKVQPTAVDDLRRQELQIAVRSAEIDLAVKQQHFMAVTDHVERLAVRLANLRAACLSLPGRLAAVLPLPAVEAIEIIEPVVHEFMAELSEDSGDDEEQEAA